MTSKELNLRENKGLVGNPTSKLTLIVGNVMLIGVLLSIVCLGIILFLGGIDYIFLFGLGVIMILLLSIFTALFIISGYILYLIELKEKEMTDATKRTTSR